MRDDLTSGVSYDWASMFDCSLLHRESDVLRKAALEAQGREYEAAAQRHLAFADQLLADKRTLTDKCDGTQFVGVLCRRCDRNHGIGFVAALAQQLKHEAIGWERRLRESEERLQAELRSAKEAWAASERTRREKWVKEKEASIREATIRGLEPEIQRLMDRHREELQRVRDEAARQMAEQAARARREVGDEVDTLRTGTESAVEAALSRERAEWRERVRRLTEEADAELAAVRRKSRQDVEDELARLTRLRREDAEAHSRELAAARIDAETRVAEAVRAAGASEQNAKLLIGAARADALARLEADRAQLRRDAEATLEVR